MGAGSAQISIFAVRLALPQMDGAQAAINYIFIYNDARADKRIPNRVRSLAGK